MVACLGVAVLASPSAAAATPSAWQAPGYDAGKSFWDSAEVTVTPARAAALKLNFTIPAPPDLNPFPDPGYDCMNPIPPVTAAGRLFDSGQNGISAYNQWSGARLWNIPQNQAYGDVNNTAQMQVSGANLVVVLSDCVSNTSAASRVLVRNAATGAPVVPDWFIDAGTASFSVVNNIVVTSLYSDDTEYVIAYDLSGHLLWQMNEVSGAGAWRGGLVSSGGLVFVYTIGQTYSQTTAVRVSDGSVAWSTGAFASFAPLAVSQDGRDLYLAGPNATLETVNPLTGAFGSISAAGRSGPFAAVDATTVYTSCAGTALCATRRSNGTSMWTIGVGAPCQPVVAVGVVYCAGKVFRATTGKRIRSAVDGVPVTAVSGGRVYGLLTSGAVASYK